MEEKYIELIARAVVLHDDNILLCKPKGESYYFFPGGHVEFEEDIATTLRRELKEEIDADVTETQFIGAWENVFLQKHELNLVFETKLSSSDIKNREDHIESKWVPLEEFKKTRVLPVLLKEKVIGWMENGEVFFGGEKDNKPFA